MGIDLRASASARAAMRIIVPANSVNVFISTPRFPRKGDASITTCAQEKRSARPVRGARKLSYIPLLGAVGGAIHKLCVTY
jgi:hypothetical protein